MDLLIAFIVGLVVMDFLWAWRMGIPQVLIARWKLRKALRQSEQGADND